MDLLEVQIKHIQKPDSEQSQAFFILIEAEALRP